MDDNRHSRDNEKETSMRWNGKEYRTLFKTNMDRLKRNGRRRKTNAANMHKRIKELTARKVKATERLYKIKGRIINNNKERKIPQSWIEYVKRAFRDTRMKPALKTSEVPEILKDEVR